MEDAINILQLNNMKIVFVVDEESRLLGTITDGDVRRSILTGKVLSTSVDKIMNSSPSFVSQAEAEDEIYMSTIHAKHRYLPVLNSSRQILSVKSRDSSLKEKKENWVFIMAGGFGKRLKPYTDNTPKPMLLVGGKPILERIILNFVDHGFSKFIISTHYKSSVITEYFGDGSSRNITVQYTYEDKPLGTAGALGLVERIPELPLIIMNGDLLTKVNFEQLLSFHQKTLSKATICVKKHEIQVPYGTVEFTGNQVTAQKEKPIIPFFINAGIYVLEPQLLKNIEKNAYKDMPNFLSEMSDIGSNISAFPIHEYWLDMGSLSEYRRAQEDYQIHFGNFD